jgi:hypothetical protein
MGDAPPLQCSRKTRVSTGISDVLRRFDQDATLVAGIVLCLVLLAAGVLVCEELVQTKSVSLSTIRTSPSSAAPLSVRATNQAQWTRLTSSTPPEASYRSVETAAPSPSFVRALSSQSNPADTQVTANQRISEPVQELAEPKSKSLRHRHASLSRSRQQPRSWKAFSGFNGRHWQAND